MLCYRPRCVAAERVRARPAAHTPPRTVQYYPPLDHNIFQRRATHVAQQLFPDVSGGMLKDYDQLLDKNPLKPGQWPVKSGRTQRRCSAHGHAACDLDACRLADAVFAWHQDMA